MVGVPEMVALDPVEGRPVRPGGRDPVEIVQVSVPIPPVACNVVGP